MAVPVTSHHAGQQAVAAGDRVKAMLAPLEWVCRYREQRGDDSARFEVTPRNAHALPFSIAIAPGGINIDCGAFSIRELPLPEAGIALAIVEAILAGRVHQVRRLKANGAPRVVKTYIVGDKGELIFKNRRSANVLGSFLASRGSETTERLRFAAYAG
jgi:hypothetical protein